MVSDREPRYQLLDSNGTVVGSLYEKSNGKLALQDGNTDTEVVFDGDTIGSGGESLDIDSLASGLKVLDLVDSVSGNTVYNSSSEQLGDGNQNADLNNVVLNDITDGTSANTVYDSSSETLGDGNQDINANSISTINLEIDSHPDVKGVESGNVTSAQISAAADDTWDTVTTNTESVTFSESFNTAPTVVVGLHGGDVYGVTVRSLSVTTSGFDMDFLNHRTTTRTPEARWVAIETA